MIGKPWSSWNLPEQPTELDLRKLQEAFKQPDLHRGQLQSTPLSSAFLPLFGQHPDTDFLSITKCPACGWLLKIQHANKHFLRDSRGAIVCKDSDLAIYGSKVLGKALHPVGEIKDSYSKRITLKIVQPAHGSAKTTHGLRGINDISLSKSRSGSSSHSAKTEYIPPSLQYRARSHTQAHPPPPPSYVSKSRTGGSSTSSSHLSHSSNHTTSSAKGTSSKSSTQTSNSSWSSLRSTSASSSASKSSSSHKPHTNSGSYTLSIPSEDMGGSESVEDLLMSSVAHNYGSSKHTVHIIASSNSSKAKAADPNYSDHSKSYYSDVPEKRIKLDSSHSRSSDHHHRDHHHHHHRDHHHHQKSSSSDGHSDSYSKSKSKHSSSALINGTVSNHGVDSKKSKSSSSSSSSHSKNETSSSSNKHHLRSSAPSTVVSATKPHVSVSSLSSSGHSSRSHTVASIAAGSADKEKDKDREKASSPKKKKRKREKDEPRKIIPLKDRDFNPDKHCGVCTTGSNLPCKRSLTCKTHSVALRRAVSGRSQSFDALLAAHKLAKTEEKNSTTTTTTTTTTATVKKTVVEEVISPKPKKKKPSGTNSNSGTSPNDLSTLGVGSEPHYDRSVSPDIEVIAVRTKPVAPAPELELVRWTPKKYNPIANNNNSKCPLIYPYEPENQAKFEEVWYDPKMLEEKTPEEKRKFKFLLCHYKNPHFLRCEVPKPIVKNVREKRNVFSNWNPHEKPLAGYQHNVSWTPGERQRQISLSESEEELQLIGHYKKK